MMPRGIELANRAQEKLRAQYKEKGINPFDPEYVKVNCDEILDQLLALEFELFKIEEQQIHGEPLWHVIESDFRDSKPYTKQEIRSMVKGKFGEFREFYKSISQSRVSRSGGSLQNHIAFILSTLSYPFEVQKVINGTPDFILPNAELYRITPSECVLITAKRTLRERWRQIITEGFRSPQYFLITIDEKQTANNLREMAQHRIYLVVPERLKQIRSVYRSAGNVISVGTLLRDYLDPAMLRWQQTGVIS